MPKREELQYILLFLTDFVSLACAAGITWLIFGGALGLILDYNYSEVSQFILVLLVSFLVSFFSLSQSRDITRRSPQTELRLVTEENMLLAAVLAVFMIVTKARMLESRYLYVGILAFNEIFLMLSHAMLKSYLIRSFRKGGFAALTGVVTTSDRAADMLNALTVDWTKKFVGVALLDEPDVEDGRTVCGIPVLANFDSFMNWVRLESLDEIYVNVPYATGESLLPYIEEMESMGLTIHLNILVLERLMPRSGKESWKPHLNGQIEQAADTPYATFSTIERTIPEQVFKRTIDIAGGLVGCVLTLPFLALVAIPLKLESPGPLIFRQKRVGLNGRVFHIYKIRSMYMDAEARKKDLMSRNEMNGLMFKVEDDPRITRVGRFIRRTSIDELPQFFNVLKGEMSLVGTRPPTLDEYEQYESHHKRRLSMKPGITGMWQVSGRSDIEDFEEVVRLDVQYIDNWSIWLDFKIIFKTIDVVLHHRGAK